MNEDEGSRLDRGGYPRVIRVRLVLTLKLEQFNFFYSPVRTCVCYQTSSEKSASDRLKMASGNIPKTSILQSCIIYRKPKPEESQRLVVKESAVLMRSHLSP